MAIPAPCQMGHAFSALKANAPLNLYSPTRRNVRNLAASRRPGLHCRGALVAEHKHGRGSEVACCKAHMLRFRLYLTATFGGAAPLTQRTAAGAELRQPLGMAVSTVSWWAISLSLDRYRPRLRLRECRTVWRLSAPDVVQRAVGFLEK